MAFRIGQKVEYIGGLRIHGNEVGMPIPHMRTPYTVANVYELDGWSMIELVELPYPGSDIYYPGFNARGFRPIVENKTDIGFAHEILRKASRTRETVA